jgi:exonuclease VII small subunit
LELYQKGVKLVQSCEKQITQAKLKVTQISAQAEPEASDSQGGEEE